MSVSLPLLSWSWKDNDFLIKSTNNLRNHLIISSLMINHHHHINNKNTAALSRAEYFIESHISKLTLDILNRKLRSRFPIARSELSDGNRNEGSDCDCEGAVNGKATAKLLWYNTFNSKNNNDNYKEAISPNTNAVCIGALVPPPLKVFLTELVGNSDAHLHGWNNQHH